jgi:PAS domain S-box-containing protein
MLCDWLGSYTMTLQFVPYGLRVGLLCVIYFAMARFGLSLDTMSGFAAAVWPPTGMALIALVLGGYCLWPGIALGAFLVNLSAGAPVLVACGMALGNTLEALVGAILLKRVAGFQPSLDRLQDVVGLVVLTGLSTLVGATIGVTSGWLGGVIPAAVFEKAWWTWWLGDALSDLVVAPLFFVWSGYDRVPLPRRWLAEAIATLVAVGVVTVVVFSGVLAQTLQFPRYLIFPPLLWAAVRLGPRGSVTATAVASACAIWALAQGWSPFAGQTLHESLFALQAFMSVAAVTILVLAAVVAERRQAEAAVQEQRERLAVTLSSIGDAVIATDSHGRVTFTNPVAESVTGLSEAEAVGKDITEVFRIINEHTRQAIENPIAKVIRVGTVVRLARHTLLIARDGVERPIDGSGAPIHDFQGRLRGVVLVLHDISVRRQVEVEAERRQRETAILTELAQSLSGTLDLDTVLQRVVAGAQELCGGERVFITLREASSSALVGRYELGAPHMAYIDLRIEPGKGLGGRCSSPGGPGGRPIMPLIPASAKST